MITVQIPSAVMKAIKALKARKKLVGVPGWSALWFDVLLRGAEMFGSS